MWDGSHYKCIGCGEIYSDTLEKCPCCGAICVKVGDDYELPPLQIYCPQCGCELLGEWSWIGRKAACPECASNFIVRYQKRRPKVIIPQHPLAPSSSQRGMYNVLAKWKSLRSSWFLVGVGVVVLTVLCTCITFRGCASYRSNDDMSWIVTRVKKEKAALEAKDRASRRAVRVGGITVNFTSEEEKCFEKAKAGDADAQYRLARILSCTDSASEARLREAFNWGERSAAQGNADGENFVGWCYINGRGVETNNVLGAEWQHKAMLHGSLKAKGNMAINYLKGRGVEKDEKKGLKYAKEAAYEGGLGYAYADVGRIYYNGIGVPVDQKEALKWFDLAVEHGEMSIATLLAGFYMDGEGVKKDLSVARRYLLKAAKVEDQQALAMLGRLCLGEKDYSGALKYIELGIVSTNKGSATDHLLSELEWQAAMIYQVGLGCKKNLSRAFVLLKMSAQHGKLEAEHAVAAGYETGSYGEKDQAEAYRRYRILQDKGDPMGEVKVAVCHWNGIGVPVDKDKAIQIMERAVKTEYDEAQNLLGKMYYVDGYKTRNYEKAFKLFLRAAEQGLPDAIFNVGVCYYMGHGVERDYSTALEYFESASQKNHGQATACIGDMYRNGEGVTKNKVMARKYYKQAISMGWNQAKKALSEL